jgi:predicted metalloprotease with PDZ domain
MLLDFEIMHLTGGQKTLKDVVFTLANKYGKDRSFAEEAIIPDFVAEVHPNLQNFFDKYVTGTQPLDISGGFAKVGIDYTRKKEGLVPVNILSEANDVKTNRNLLKPQEIRIRKVGKGDMVGFLVNDKVNKGQILKAYKDEKGNYISEGETVTITVLREGKEVELRFPARYTEGTLYNLIEINQQASETQKALWQLWTEGRNEAGS